MMENENNMAFPINDNTLISNYGLTKREYFAAMAMQGLLANPEQINTKDSHWVARSSVRYADFILKQLNKNVV